MALPLARNIALYQGDSFELIFRLKDINGDYVNLTGAVPKAQIRASATSPTVVAEFTAVLLNQTTTPGGVRLTLTPVQTAAFTTKGVWDVQLTYTDGTIQTYLYGDVTIQNEVTRA